MCVFWEKGSLHETANGRVSMLADAVVHKLLLYYQRTLMLSYRWTEPTGAQVLLPKQKTLGRRDAKVR